MVKNTSKNYLHNDKLFFVLIFENLKFKVIDKIFNNILIHIVIMQCNNRVKYDSQSIKCIVHVNNLTVVRFQELTHVF